MTRGIVIFAYNSDQLDYLGLAAWSAQNIHRHLDLPVCVITDCDHIPDRYQFDQVIQAARSGTGSRYFADLDATVPWYNGNRVDAYALSPWDQTLVLDADYVVASDQLKCLFDTDQDFLAHQQAYDVTGKDNFDELNCFGRYHNPMSWATVMLFRRSQQAELIFDTMQMIRHNWDHYRNLFGIDQSNYRNDFALSIALSTVNGHVLDQPSIPWSLATVTHEHQLSQIEQDHYRVDWLTADSKPRWIDITQDFHAMGKQQLGAIIANSR
jgi:hypothetical protein